MSSHDEVNDILSSKGIKDILKKDDKSRISHDIHSQLPISLEIMACYDETLPAIDLDKWNASRESISALMIDTLFDEKYYLFIKAFPKNFMLLLNKEQLSDIIFDDEFCYPFAIFSINLTSFLIEEDSGAIIGCGDFSRVIQSEL
jgi:hypothetical protein